MSRPEPQAPIATAAFRRQWLADLATSWAIEMETLILGWYILTETGSVVWLTVFASLQYGGTLVSPMFGVAADRLGHRPVLVAMRAFYTGIALLLTGLALAGALAPLLVLVIAGINGLVRPSDSAMRTAVVAGIVPPVQLARALGISRTTYDSARVFGALTGAALAAGLGLAHAYVMVTVLYLIGTLLTLTVQCPTPSAPPSTSPAVTHGTGNANAWRDLVDGLLYAWRSPPLLACLTLAFLVNLAAFPVTHGLLPHVARTIYGTGQSGLGHLAASFAMGALVGSVGLSLARLSLAATGRVMIVFAGVWFLALLGFGHATTPALGIPLLMLAGVGQSLSTVPLAVLLIRHADERYRGRVMGARMLAIYGLPVGMLVAGPLVARIGFSTTVTGYALFGLAATALIAIRWRRAVLA